jgi:hypothetical protein
MQRTLNRIDHDSNPMPTRLTSTILAALAVGLAGCASQSASMMPPSAMITQTGSNPGAETVSALPPPGTADGYQLTASELDLNCKQLTGRTAVRIVQLRDYASRAKTTALSRSIQGASSTMLGGTMAGVDPDGRYVKDRAMLAAYNKRLVEKNCPSFDLETELDPSATEPPRVRMPDKS